MRVAIALAWAIGAASGGIAQLQEDDLQSLATSYLWPSTDAEFRQAATRIAEDASLVGITRMQMHDLAEALRRGRPDHRSAPEAVDGRIPIQELAVRLPGGATVPVLVRLPLHYSPDRRWPLILAMHGGPPGRPQGVRGSAERMIRVWADAAERAGWIVAAPGMLTTVSAGGRTRDRLPYEVFHQEDARAAVDAVRREFNVNPNRIASTGISLGSNFSIAYAGAHPDWLSAIVPVSTEGDSREALLRNLHAVPVYVLEGSQDRNIRGVSGPRALQEILAGFGYDITYREFGDRGHEGFQEHYDDVLRWLDARPRSVYPRQVLRVPHEGIMPIDRRVHWIEVDTRQALLRARVRDPRTIDIDVRFARRLHVYLHDRLVDLDQPIAIHVNGELAFSGRVPRSARTALEQARILGDEARVYAARVTVDVPGTPAALEHARTLSRELAPGREPGPLSFWEMYAQRAIEERFGAGGFNGVEEGLPDALDSSAEQVGIRMETDSDPLLRAGVQYGDLLLEVDGEPFFRGNGGIMGLYGWLVRELRSRPAEYRFVVWRDGALHRFDASLQLGPYADR